MKKFAFTVMVAASLGLTAIAAEIPRPAPENMVLLPGGKQAKVQDYKGKVIVLAYILTT